MSLFNAIDISGTGVDAMQTWIDTAGGNIANADDAVKTTEPTYAEQTAEFSPISAAIPGEAGEGVKTTVDLGSTTGTIAYEPDSPLANAEGDVRVPDISLSDQLVGLMEAQDDYEANTDAMSHAVAAYQAGLTIGS